MMHLMKASQVPVRAICWSLLLVFEVYASVAVAPLRRLWVSILDSPDCLDPHHLPPPPKSPLDVISASLEAFLTFKDGL
jgi:hypothetical protein